MDAQVTLICSDVGPSKLHRLFVPGAGGGPIGPLGAAIAHALEGEYPPPGIHVQQPGIGRIQPGDTQTLLPA